MIFFVVVPIFYGGFANFLLPYHIGSKDVAYPRLNNLGFWIQPCGFVLIVKISGMRLEYWTTEVKTNYANVMNTSINFFKSIYYNEVLQLNIPDLLNYNYMILKNLVDDEKKYVETLIKVNILNLYDLYFSYKLLFWSFINDNSEILWFLTKNAKNIKKRKRQIVKCSNATQTVSGWTFITPFSSNTSYTGIGIQDMLILGVYFVGISTTISFINLLVTRRVLSMSGLKNRRILIPFITTSILLMLRALSVITPILGSAMLMLLTDRHWKTSFFDFAYGIVKCLSGKTFRAILPKKLSV